MCIRDSKETLCALGDALRGDLVTAVPVVTHDVLIGVVRRHNNCLGVLREGCDLLVKSLEVVKEQQRLVARVSTNAFIFTSSA